MALYGFCPYLSFRRIAIYRCHQPTLASGISVFAQINTLPGAKGQATLSDRQQGPVLFLGFFIWEENQVTENVLFKGVSSERYQGEVSGADRCV